MIPVLASHDIDGIMHLHLLAHDNKNEIQHDLLNHLILLALTSASCNVYSIVNNVIYSLGHENLYHLQHTFLSFDAINGGVGVS